MTISLSQAALAAGAGGGFVVANNGDVVHLDSCQRTRTVNASNQVTADTAFDGLHTYTKTYTYNGAGVSTAETFWTFIS